jgi:MFS family permease
MSRHPDERRDPALARRNSPTPTVYIGGMGRNAPGRPSTTLRRAVWLLGASQCVYWGVLYYGFPVLMLPLERDLGLSRTPVAGAFSFGLLVMALVAPAVGRGIDRDVAHRIMRAGLGLAVLGLVGLSCVTSAAQLYVAWGVLGAAMGTLLYEPAFGLVIRAFDEAGARLRALSAVAVMGGMASTLFLPLLATLLDAGGWRFAILCSAIAVLVAGALLERGVFPVLVPLAANASVRPPHAPDAAVATPRGFFSLSLLFVAGTCASMGLAVLLIPLLIERGLSAALAASVLAALGISQLPGRLWLLRHRGEFPPWLLTMMPPALQASGLLMLVSAGSAAVAVAGVILFGTGAGLHTLARPWLIQRLYGSAISGQLNGRIARAQGIARAAAPLLVAAASTLAGIPAVFIAMSAVLALLMPLAWQLQRQPPHRIDAIAIAPAGGD